MPFWRKVLNLYLYSSLHISLGAASLVYVTFLVFDRPPNSGYVIFSFFATLLMYSIHRIVGIEKMVSFQQTGRFAIIFKYKKHIIIYAIVALLGSLYYYFSFDFRIKILLIPAVVVAAAYALPFYKKKRLRDFNYIKIFMISFSWAYVATIIPLEIMGIENKYIAIILFLEKAAFIFALTIPFDIRDLKIDDFTQVVTIPKKIGIGSSIYLSCGLLIFAMVMAIILYGQEVYPLEVSFSTILVYLLTIPIIGKVPSQDSDYFFTGIIDGLILFYGLLIILILVL